MYRCKTHPRYKAKLKPRSTCEACWWLWFGRKGNKLSHNHAAGLQWIDMPLEIEVEQVYKQC